MKYKQFLILLSLIFIAPMSIHSQNKKIGILTNTKKHYKSMYNSFPLTLGLSINLNNQSFYSQGFIENLKNELLEETNKYSLGLNANYHNYHFDFNYFSTKYKASTGDFNFSGFESFISYRLSLIKTFRLDPYFGIGYQFSTIKYQNSILDTSQSLWKVGVSPMLPLEDLFDSYGDFSNQALFFIIEYKQSFNTENSHSFNNLSYGLGYSIFFN